MKNVNYWEHTYEPYSHAAALISVSGGDVAVFDQCLARDLARATDTSDPEAASYQKWYKECMGIARENLSQITKKVHIRSLSNRKATPLIQYLFQQVLELKFPDFEGKAPIESRVYCETKTNVVDIRPKDESLWAKHGLATPWDVKP